MSTFLSTLFRPLRPFFLSEPSTATNGHATDDSAGLHVPTKKPITPGAGKMTHYPRAQSTFPSTLPCIANENAFLGDVYSSEDSSQKPSAPISCGFFRLEKGTPLVYTYTYHEMKIVVEGEFVITDLGPEGEEGAEGEAKGVHVKPGDVLYFEEGARIKFETPTRALAFYTGQRAKGAA